MPRPGERHEPAEFEEALVEASMAASRNPAELYGLTDRGSIAPGKGADLLVSDTVKNDYPVQLRLKQIIQDGEKLAVEHVENATF